jgi:hypothetical protein
VNITLLRMLQARPDSYFWPESVARSLKISPARLLRDLNELEEFWNRAHPQSRRPLYRAGPPVVCRSNRMGAGHADHWATDRGLEAGHEYK